MQGQRRLHPLVDGLQEQANEAVLALIALGYKQVEAHKAVRDIQQSGKEIATAEDLVRLTLQRLASGR